MSSDLFSGGGRFVPKGGMDAEPITLDNAEGITPRLRVQLATMNYLKSAARYAFGLDADGDSSIPPLEALDKICAELSSTYKPEVVAHTLVAVRTLRESELAGMARAIDILEESIGWLCNEYSDQDVPFLSGVFHHIYDLRQQEEYFGEEVGVAPAIDPEHSDNLLLLDDEGLHGVLTHRNGFFSPYFSRRSIERQYLIEAKLDEAY